MFKDNTFRLKIYLSVWCITGSIFATSGPQIIDNDYNAVLWQRTSAERNALYRQIFLLSKSILLHSKINMVKKGTTCGVVFDLDETLLDNSKYSYTNVIKSQSFNPLTWDKFVNSKSSVAFPGAVDITSYVHLLGCKVNIVTVRQSKTVEATQAVLNKEGIYYDQILFTNGADKNLFFKAVTNGISPSLLPYKQTIIAYFGDNIKDFPNGSQEYYKGAKDDKYAKFGTEYFVLPNPMYGSWLQNKFN